MICAKCTSPFPNRVKINGVTKNISSRKYCLACSPFGKHNTSVLHGPRGSNSCLLCKKDIAFNQIKFCSRICKNRYHGRSTAPGGKTYMYQKRRAVDRKVRFITDAGGKCSKCGYCKNLAALHFHHKDKGSKLFRLDARAMSGSSMEMLEEEVKKCVVLCGNCHAELHNPQLTGKLHTTSLLSPQLDSNQRPPGPKPGALPS